jgi:hypothetical protein
VLQITSIDYTSAESEKDSRSHLVKIIQNLKIPAFTPPDLIGTGTGAAIEAGCSYLEQFLLLYTRIRRDAARNKTANIVRTVRSLGTVLIMVALYSNLDGGDVLSNQIKNTTALLCFIVTAVLFAPLYGTIQTFAPEVNVVQRERMNNLYAVGPYYLAKLLVVIPVETTGILISNSVAYWAMKLNHSPMRYITFLLFTGCCSFCSMGIGLSVAAAFGGNVQASSAAVGPLSLILLLLGGFYINEATIPGWISWLYKVNYVGWTYEGLTINQFYDSYAARTGAKIIEGKCAPGQPAHICQDGTDILDELFNNGDRSSESDWVHTMWFALFSIISSFVFFNILGYLCLSRKGPKYLKMERDSRALREEALRNYRALHSPGESELKAQVTSAV